MNYNEITKRIDELNLDGYKHIKNNDWEDYRDLKLWLHEKNFTKMGRGIFSIVYGSPTENFVVKVNEGSIDEGYLKFVEFCHQNKGNPHLPKMGQIKKYKDWYIIFIEKLEPVSLEDFGFEGEMAMYRFFNDLINEYDNNNEENFKDLIKEKYFKKTRRDPSDDLLNQLYSIISLMYDYKKTITNRSLDIHSGNIMKRGSTFVVTDPAG